MTVIVIVIVTVTVIVIVIVIVVYCGTERPTSALLQKKKNIFDHEGDRNLRDMSWKFCLSVPALRMTKISRLSKSFI